MLFLIWLLHLRLTEMLSHGEMLYLLHVLSWLQLKGNRCFHRGPCGVFVVQYVLESFSLTQRQDLKKNLSHKDMCQQGYFCGFSRFHI